MSTIAKSDVEAGDSVITFSDIETVLEALDEGRQLLSEIDDALGELTGHGYSHKFYDVEKMLDKAHELMGDLVEVVDDE